MIHHVAVQNEAPAEIQKARAKGHASVPRHHHRVAPVPLGELLAIDRDHLEGISMDMKYMVVVMLVDDGPFLDRPQRNALVDAIGVETAATEEGSEVLIAASRPTFG